MTGNEIKGLKKVGLHPISLINVTYNAGDLLEQTILSVIEHFDEIDEFIIIDGQSTDNTLAIIEKYKSYITFHISEPDKGIYDAMNKGWRQANNDNYILFLGSGDLLGNLPGSQSFAKAPILAGEVQIGAKFLYKPKTDIRLKLGNTLHHQALLIKKSLHIPPRLI